MSDDAFIRGILADPSDDALRLVYADWLEEQGDASRAEYLRLLCRLSGATPPVAEQMQRLHSRLEELRSIVEPAWVGLMHRGRVLPQSESATKDLCAEGPAGHPVRESKRQRPFNEAEVGLFLQQYGRKGCNDRVYSRKVEKRIKRMKPEDLDRLIRGEED